MNHHTKPHDIGVLSWEILDHEWEVCAPALIDRAHQLETGDNLLARINYDEALAFAALVGGQLISSEQLDQLRDVAFVQLMPYLGTPRAENGIEHSRAHDRDVWQQLKSAEWEPGKGPVMGAGKHWIAGAPPGKSRLKGWDRDGAGPGKSYWQEAAVAHDRHHYDDGTTTLIVRRRTRPDGTSLARRVVNAAKAIGASVLSALTIGPTMTTRPTLRRGTSGEHVSALQHLLGISADGSFGPATEAAVKRRQSELGLVADGVVGTKTWRALGETPAAPAQAAPGRDPRAPACVSALRDANASWPSRRRASDGIMGDAAHQARPSDHNLGNAVDITHDPEAGCDGDVLSRMAIQDPRVSYVIWDREIWSRSRSAEGWRRYTGSNPHTHHCHISVRAEAREDASPWPWAPPDEAA